MYNNYTLMDSLVTHKDLAFLKSSIHMAINNKPLIWCFPFKLDYYDN